MTHPANDDNPVEGYDVMSEIEQLRGHKEEADRHIKTIAELRAEVERLKADNHRLMMWNEELQAKIDALKDTAP